MESGPGAMVIVNCPDLVFDAASVTVTVNVKVPMVVGLPENTPLELMAKPAVGT